MIRNLSCTEITCDDCGDDCFEDGTPHFESVDKAKASGWLEGWLFTDIEQVCRRCYAKRTCEAEGHDWDEWRQSARDDLTAYRVCERCDAWSEQ